MPTFAFVTKQDPEGVVVQFTRRDEIGDTVSALGDGEVVVSPGETWYGWSFEELLNTPEIEITIPRPD
jgi:tRNA A37 threonylcarbamoyladenosine synthetase subunit TsaC/SUA5/YrdC